MEKFEWKDVNKAITIYERLQKIGYDVMGVKGWGRVIYGVSIKSHSNGEAVTFELFENKTGKIQHETTVKMDFILKCLNDDE